MQKLIKIMALLRDPEFGCPWDLEQSRESLTRYTLEEVYEVVDAIEQGTPDAIKDELGDLLFQIVFYARLAEEENQFSFDDIVDTISQKLLRRHPHVFPGGSIDGFGERQTLAAEEVVTNWEAIKSEERQIKGRKEGSRASLLEDIPKALPALERALKLQKRAARVGFDWQGSSEVMEKVREELLELEEAMASGNSDAINHEAGDLLFAVVNLTRHLQVEPETVLRESNRRFTRRFAFIEEQLELANCKPEEVGLEKLDELWSAAKKSGL